MYPSMSQFRAHVTTSTATSFRCTSPLCSKIAPVNPSRTLNGAIFTIAFCDRALFRPRSHIISFRSISSLAVYTPPPVAPGSYGLCQIRSAIFIFSPRFLRSETFLDGTAKYRRSSMSDASTWKKKRNDCSVFGICATHGSQNAQLPPSVSSTSSVGESRATVAQHLDTASIVKILSSGIRMNSLPKTCVEIRPRGRRSASAIVAQSCSCGERFIGSLGSHIRSSPSISSSSLPQRSRDPFPSSFSFSPSSSPSTESS
jgi:hypothetical protein